LRREIEDLRAKGPGGDMSASEFQTAHKKWEDLHKTDQAIIAERDKTIVEKNRIIARLENENAALRAKLEPAQEVVAEAFSEIATANTVIAGDPGPMPDCLLRKPKEKTS